jgi:hypothetical protein
MNLPKTSANGALHFLWGTYLHFGWLAVLVLSPDWQYRILKYATIISLGEAATPDSWGEGCAVHAPSFHHLIPWHLPYN